MGLVGEQLTRVPVRVGALILTSSVLLVGAVAAVAPGAQELAARVESANVSSFGYTVDVSYVEYSGSASLSGAQNQMTAARPMRKIPGDRLKSSRDGSARRSGVAAEGGGVPFVVDIGSMLAGMSGRVDWTLGGMAESGGMPCRLLHSQGEGWRVDLCIRESDGAVLRYGQHLNGQEVAVSDMRYDAPVEGVYLPSSSRTYFPLTDQSVEITYENYVVESR